MIVEFKGKFSVEVRRQEKLDLAEKQDFGREESSRKYMVKMLYE